MTNNKKIKMCVYTESHGWQKWEGTPEQAYIEADILFSNSMPYSYLDNTIKGYADIKNSEDFWVFAGEDVFRVVPLSDFIVSDEIKNLLEDYMYCDIKKWSEMKTYKGYSTKS